MNHQEQIRENIKQANVFIQQNNYPAAANYTRKAFEDILKLLLIHYTPRYKEMALDQISLETLGAIDTFYNIEVITREEKELLEYIRKAGNSGSHSDNVYGNCFNLNNRENQEMFQLRFKQFTRLITNALNNMQESSQKKKKTKSVMHDRIESEFLLGYSFFIGDGVKKNYAEAEKHFLNAALQEHAEAQRYMGLIKRKGYNGDVDLHLALTWYIRSAKNGNRSAQDRAAIMLEEQKKYKESAEWYKKAAGNGSNHAQYRLGFFYYSGLGVTKDLKKAFKYFSLAANKNKDAQRYLGIMYRTGKGVQTDLKKAAAWYLKAAENGSVESQERIGIMYEEGCGVKKDYKKAAHWYKIAIKNGHSSSKKRLDNLKNKGLI